MSKKPECPICFGAKQYYNGRKYVDCNTCDKEGRVSQETYDIICHEDEDD